MEVKKDSIFSPQSKRNLVVTASLTMALGMGVAPGIALADEVDAAPTITRAQTETVDMPIVAAVETPAVDAAPTIRRNGADTLVAESTSSTSSTLDWVVTDTATGVTNWNINNYGTGSTSTSTSSGHSTTTTYTQPGSYTYDTTHTTTTTTNQNGYIPVLVIGDPNGGETSSNNGTPYNGTVNVSLGKNDTVQQTTQNTNQTTEIKTDAKVDQNTTQRLGQTLQKTDQTMVYPIIDQPVVSDATDVAKEELSDFIADAALTSDFADQLDAESVTVVGEPVLKAIAEGVFEILKMPDLVVEKAEPATTKESYWWCVYIDGAKTRIMDTLGNLAEGIDHFLWSPEGTVDPTSFEDSNVVYAQDPGMTVVMTASSMLGVQAMAEPEHQGEGGYGEIKPDVVVDTNTIDTDVTDVVEPNVSMSGRIASYIPTQQVAAPAVEAAAEKVETLAVTADPTDATPAVAWGAAGVATLLFAALRRRNEA